MPEPVFVALLLADRVITEDNQKKGIIGTFNQFNLRQLPALLPGQVAVLSDPRSGHRPLRGV